MNTLNLDNPYWAEVADKVRPGEMSWEGPTVHSWPPMEGFDAPDRPWASRTEHVKLYSWTITDPISVEFVATHSGPAVVDPMAGTGYWAYLLGQLGIHVACYDLHTEENTYHRNAEQWVGIDRLDAADAVKLHPQFTLLLSWPPYSEDVGARALAAYKGSRVILISEGEGGCCGTDEMFEDLHRNWREVADHTPVQWWGLHDRITVYDRNPEPNRFSELDIEEEKA